MPSSLVLKTVILLVTLLSLALPRGVAAEANQRPPNFIVIFADDQGYGDLGCFGSTRISSPHIDSLAEQGMRLTSFYVTHPNCSPSRASLLTGCYTKRVSVTGVLHPGASVGLHPDEVTVAEVLQDRGYATTCVGKWHLGDQPEFLPTRQGFDEYFGIPYSNDMQPANISRYPPLPLMQGERVIETDPDQDFLTRRYTEYAVDFIQRNHRRPFFLYLPHSMPHRPCHASPPFMQRFSLEERREIHGEQTRARDFIYPACIEEIDWSVGQIVAVLRRLDLDRHTLLVFTSDNGPAQGGSAGPLRGGKGTTWEGGVRVPCVAWWPGHIPAGTVCDEIATTMDILPTFAALADAQVPADRVIDGKDIRPLLLDPTEASSPYESFLYYKGQDLRAVRSGPWKLHLARRSDQANSLYHLERDIGEQHDVIAEHREVAARLMRLAEAARADLGDAGLPGQNVRPAGHVENPAPLTHMHDAQ